MTDSQKQLLSRFGLLVLLIVAVYGNTLNHGFVWDDNSIIVNNPVLEHLKDIPQLFLAEDEVEAGDSTGYYRPVTYVSFSLERALWGTNPFGYHVTNLVLHLLVVLLFYRVVAELFRNEHQAFFSSLIFALHPMVGETVNFLSGGRNTLLSACFSLLALLFYVRNKTVLAITSFTLAIFSKEFALLLPVVFLMRDRWLERERFNWRKYLPYVVPIVCFLIIRSFAVKRANFLANINPMDVVVSPYMVLRYVQNMIFPFNLKVMYSAQLSLMGGIILCVVLVSVLGAILYARKHDEARFAVIWFFLFLLPVINIVPLHTTTMMADRYAYFSLMGFALGLGILVRRIDNTRIAAAVVVILCSVYSIIDVNRNSIWANEIEFFTRMTQDAPERFDGFNNLGMNYYEKGNLAHAIYYLELADSRPNIPYSHLVGNAYVFWKENRLDSAENALTRALKLQPANAEPYLIMMLINEQKGNLAAVRMYRDKLQKDIGGIDGILKDRVVALCRQGETYMHRRRYVDADILFWQALMIDPGYVPALVDMGSLKAEQGDMVGAIQYLNRALAIEPLNSSAHYNLATIYQMQGKFPEVEQEMNRYRAAEEASRRKGR